MQWIVKIVVFLFWFFNNDYCQDRFYGFDKHLRNGKNNNNDTNNKFGYCFGKTDYKCQYQTLQHNK